MLDKQCAFNGKKLALKYTDLRNIGWTRESDWSKPESRCAGNKCNIKIDTGRNQDLDKKYVMAECKECHCWLGYPIANLDK